MPPPIDGINLPSRVPAGHALLMRATIVAERQNINTKSGLLCGVQTLYRPAALVRSVLRCHLDLMAVGEELVAEQHRSLLHPLVAVTMYKVSDANGSGG